MICKNCGFHNAEGDEFCGSCGQYLEWSGVKADDAQAGASAAAPAGADGSQGAAVPPPRVDDSTTAMAVPPPPPAPPAGMGPPPPPPTAGGASPQFSGRGPDVICWNCGRRNPGGRTFCIQCGERLTAGKPTSGVKAAGAAAGAGAAGAGVAGAGMPPGAPPPPGSSGGLNLKWIGIGAVIIALLIVAVVGASFLGGTTQPTPTVPLVALVTPTPSGSATASPLATATASPTTALPTDTPTAVLPTDTPTAAITPSPTAKPTAKPTPKPTPKPTAPPTSGTCTNAGHRTRTVGFNVNLATFTVPAHTAMCVRDVTFTAGSGSGQLKLYLINSAFNVSPYGWAEALMPNDFGGGSTYDWPLSNTALPNGYDNIPPGTVIEFKITCSGGPCSGSVVITYTPVSVP